MRTRFALEILAFKAYFPFALIDETTFPPRSLTSRCDVSSSYAPYGKFAEGGRNDDNLAWQTPESSGVIEWRTDIHTRFYSFARNIGSAAEASELRDTDSWITSVHQIDTSVGTAFDIDTRQGLHLAGIPDPVRLRRS